MADPLIGSLIGAQYTIRKMIGRGGVGLVYAATQSHDDAIPRDVVVKVLAPQWASDPETVARFSREVKRLSTLKHPNIVEMYDHGTDAARPYLVMEYCQGELLSDYVDRNRALSIDQFVPIAAQLLKGVGHCHSREMMVRDIKPANIMLVQRKGRANFVKVLDFGLAKLIKGDEKVTEEHVMGTVGYLSPEQIKGEDLDLRVDVYALGVLFYSMLSGRMPFDGKTNATVFYKTVNEPPPDLHEMLPEGHEVPAGLIDLIHRCLAKDPDQRPADADAIVEHLIDVVPAALFRLPRADAPQAGVASNGTPPGHGNTGMMELLGADTSPTTPMPRLQHDPDPDPGPPAAQAELAHEPTSRTVAVVPQRSKMPIVAACLAALVGIATAGWALSGREPGSTSESAAVADRTAPEDAAVPAGLDAAQASIEAGDLEEARSRLDAIVAEPGSAAAARLSRLGKRLEVAQLVAAGKRFDDDGNPGAALGAFRDALAIDATNVAAREAVVRLEAAGQTAETAGPPAPVAIDATPDGELFIDGVAVGDTPYAGELAPGKHTLEIRAHGYETWRGALDVSDAGARPVAVALDKARRSGRPSRRKPTPAASPPAAPAEPAASPPAAPPPRPTEPAKAGPFLPTKDKDNDSVFLPTKD